MQSKEQNQNGGTRACPYIPGLQISERDMIEFFVREGEGHTSYIRTRGAQKAVMSRPKGVDPEYRDRP